MDIKRLELDLNRFRTLIPLDSLDDDKIRYLAGQARLQKFHSGETVFNIGDYDNDVIFLMHGELTLTDENGAAEVTTASRGKGRHALANLKPRRYRGTVASDSAIIARMDAILLDRALTLGHLADQVQVDELDGPDALDSEWMMAMLQSPLFRKLPAGHIQRLFEHLEQVEMQAGQTVIRQGDPGDYFYLIKQGECEVTRSSGETTAKLAILYATQSFGEEALLSDSPRNASVTMVTDGLLMRLSQEDFRALMEEPVLHWVDLSGASQLVRDGAIRVDVRTEQEFEQSQLKSALNIPLFLLRLRLPQLDRKRKYVLYCDNGARSSAAAFIMSQQGFDVAVLKGGLAAIQTQATNGS